MSLDSTIKISSETRGRLRTGAAGAGFLAALPQHRRRGRLKDLGKKGESYDAIIRRLIEREERERE